MRNNSSVFKITILLFSIFVNSAFLSGQTDSIYRIPSGTRIRVKLDAEINSKVSSVNDTFLATLAKPVVIRDVVVVPIGTEIEGRVSEVSPASSGGRDGTLEVVFQTLSISNEKRSIVGVRVLPIVADSSRTVNILSLLGGLAIGAVVGTASESPNGSILGAAIGAGIGTGVALLRNGKDVRIRKSEEFEIELKKEVILPVLDF